MVFSELNKEQKIQLKQNLYCSQNDNVSYGELTDIDDLVSDSEIEQEFGDMIFTEEDFFNF